MASAGSIGMEDGGNPGALEVLKQHGVDIDHMSWQLASSVPWIISKTVDCSEAAPMRVPIITPNGIEVIQKGFVSIFNHCGPS